MKLNKKVIALFMTLALAVHSIDAKKKAFTVFIGDYPNVSGWSKIHAGNDRAIILETLKKNGFTSSDIVCLVDSQATHDTITKSLRKFVSSCQTGDNVYIHFSCHGQWITDVDGDERQRNPRDHYDESIIPYDAQIAYNWDRRGYKGENHLVDDELNVYLIDIEKRIGRKGCLMVVIDACHSGDAQRGASEDMEEDNYVCRGSKYAFELPLTNTTTTQYVSKDTDCFIITACHDFQSNYECSINGMNYGRLSYAISRAWRPEMTQESLKKAIEDEFDSLQVLSPLPNGHTQSPVFIFSKKYSNKKNILIFLVKHDKWCPINRIMKLRRCS